MTRAVAATSIAMLALTVAASPIWAQGQTVYRCGPDGRQFSDQPCSGGQRMDVAQAPRPAADLADAQARAAREREQAAAIEARQQRLAALDQPVALRGSRLHKPDGAAPAGTRATKRPSAADGRLNRPAPPEEAPLRQARSPHRLAAAGTSP